MIANHYPLLRKILFTLNPETAHYLTLKMLSVAHSCKLTQNLAKNQPKRVMGLDFPNILGLAAGFDKNGDFIDALASLGFGFLEVGTVTPRAQEGNPKPRLFRLIEDEAIINRLGFNNKGIDYLIERLKKTRYKGILGINIGKNHDTSLENAVDDYVLGFRKVASLASYITINIMYPLS